MRFSSAEQVREAFESEYGRIHAERFRDLPIANPALAVRVVGLRETEELFTFALVTPWMLNQVAVPKVAEIGDRVARSMRRDQREALGEFLVRNRVSPMDRFTTMEAAVEAAARLAEELFVTATGENEEEPQDASRRELLRRMAGRRQGEPRNR